MKLNKNMGTVDRSIRLVIVVAIAVLYFARYISGIAAIILGLLALILLLTSLIGFCPLYVPLGIFTRKKD